MALGKAVLISSVARLTRVLVAIGEGTVPPDAARITAIRIVLDTAIGLSEWADIDERLRAVEEVHHEKTL